jgi:class 3 adenylate cyclase
VSHPDPFDLDPPVPATALLVDLRNFTPLLNSSGHDESRVNRFCYFLRDVYGVVLRSCLTAVPPARRADPPILANSTGDGALVVFTGDRHSAAGFLAAVLLDAALTRECARYRREEPGTAGLIGFGIGVESGKVTRVRAGAGGPVLDTYVGPCINVAARAEGVTKLIERAGTVFSDGVVEEVAEDCFGARFGPLREAEAASRTDADRLPHLSAMRDLNHRLCISYIHRHYLKGVDGAVPLYRLSRSALDPSLPRFWDLLARLVGRDAGHLAEVLAHLAPPPGDPDPPPG